MAAPRHNIPQLLPPTTEPWVPGHSCLLFSVPQSPRARIPTHGSRRCRAGPGTWQGLKTASPVNEGMNECVNAPVSECMGADK